MDLTFDIYNNEQVQEQANLSNNSDFIFELIYDSLVEELSHETNYSFNEVIDFLNSINLSKKDYIDGINGETSIEDTYLIENLSSINPQLDKYLNEVFDATIGFNSTSDLKKSLESILEKSVIELRNEDYLIIYSTIDIAQHSIEYWMSFSNNSSENTRTTYSDDCIDKNKVVKADIRGAVSGAVRGFIMGSGVPGVGNGLGGVLGGLMGASTRSSFEGIKEYIRCN